MEHKSATERYQDLSTVTHNELKKERPENGNRFWTTSHSYVIWFFKLSETNPLQWFLTMTSRKGIKLNYFLASDWARMCTKQNRRKNVTNLLRTRLLTWTTHPWRRLGCKVGTEVIRCQYVINQLMYQFWKSMPQISWIGQHKENIYT